MYLFAKPASEWYHQTDQAEDNLLLPLKKKKQKWDR